MHAHGSQPVRRVIILGSTGSIGTQTLDVLAHLNRLAEHDRAQPRYQVVGLAAGRRADALADQAAHWRVPTVALADPCAPAPPGARVLSGPGAAEELVRSVDCDVVVAAMVGASGLAPTLAAVELGRDVALANKETLVAAGSVIVPAARRTGSRLLPVDSEHSALWQCLQGLAGEPHACPPMAAPPGVERVILTASGGALRDLSAEQVYHATPAMALNHPTWSMGAKVTIDSASLTNKAFEVIEAHWLFGVPGDRIAVLVHPQSIVHSMVHYADGNLIAQLGSPDMRGPIQYAFTFPHRPAASARQLDLLAMSRLDFRPPDPQRYPALPIAYDVIAKGGASGAIFNAVSEVAVEAFLNAPAHSPMPFGRMGELVLEAMSALPATPVRDLRDVLEADRQARDWARSRLAAAALHVRPALHAPAHGELA
jgi:1-deoxy-D-xylulose-5-phosphate reductoisomerase